MVQNNNLKEINLNGGVLIIGSLLWDENELRENWRNKSLRIADKIKVSAPIRYGRVSKSRNYTFSMVFSQECNDKDKMGKAFFVPFRDNPIDFDKLKTQTIELIKSERDKPDAGERFNWDWGALTIVLNPKILLKDSDKYIQANALLYYWEKCYGNGFNPDNYKVGEEIPVLDKRGVLSFTWPDELKDYDFLIATATKPDRDKYPTAKEITDRIIVNEYSEYFENNIKSGIETFQDKHIREILTSNIK